jgi:transitional endoplasmic reticulum ATPase
MGSLSRDGAVGKLDGLRWTGRRDRAAIWTLRALCHEGLWRTFQPETHRMRNAVYRAIGMELDLLDTPTDPAGFRDKLHRRLAVLERRWRGRDGLTPARTRGVRSRTRPSAAAEANVARVATLLELSDVEGLLLALAVLSSVEPALEECMRALDDIGLSGLRGLCELAAVMLDRPSGAVSKSLARERMLARSGLVRVEYSITRDDVSLQMDAAVLDALVRPARGQEELLGRLLCPAPAAAIDLDQYPHLTADLEMTVPYLRDAVHGGRAGVNVLLWGPPGTGKTELSRALPARVGGSGYEVADVELDGNPAGRHGRLARYLLCQELLRRGGRSLVLFDEIEDVFLDPLHSLRDAGGGREKALINRLLEENPIPTVWIANEISHMDPAVIRRFDLVIHVRRPPRAVRRSMLGYYLGDLPVRQDWLDRIASDERLAPADVSRAARVVASAADRGSDGVEAAFERVVEGSLRARGFKPRPMAAGETADYDLSLLNSPIDVSGVVAAIAREGRGTLCLYGPPGTGKTCLAHHLARALDRPLLLRRASDLLGPYVGQTEAAIASMFEQAQEDDAVLLLDEADGFLRDRRGAQQSWEVTQVNELLVGIERFGGVFVAATNLIDGLDPAVFRRFALKVRFDPLTAEQRQRLFRRLCEDVGVAGSQAETLSARAVVARLDGLTPGDFAAARARSVLAPPGSVELLATGLGEDLALRAPVARAVGFRG